MNAVKLARLASAVSEAGQYLQRVAENYVHLLVASIRKVDVFLPRILRERNVPDRSISQRSSRDELFFHKGAVRVEYLNSVIGSITDIQETVDRELGAVHRISKLLGGRRIRIVASEIGIVRLVAVSAPIPFELAGIGVNHSHAFVQIAVRDVCLICFRVDKNLGNATEVLRVIAAARLAGVAELSDELAVLRELQHLGIVRAVSADPHVAFVVDRDAVIRFGPLVALSRTAPVADQVARLIELENRRRF